MATARDLVLGYLGGHLPPHVVQGIDWNIADESGWNPGINEIAPTVPGSRGGYGLYQLTGPRRKAYEAQAGGRLDDPLAQAKFLLQELDTTESRARDRLLATKTPEEAAAVFASDFLRPAPQNLARRVAKYTGGDMSVSGRNYPDWQSRPGVFGRDDFDPDFPMFDPGPTWQDRAVAGMAAAAEGLSAAGGGYKPDWAATDDFLRQQAARRMRTYANDQYGGKDGENMTLGQLERMNPQLAEAVRNGLMSAEDAFKIAYEEQQSGLVDPDAPTLNDDQMKMANTLRDEATKSLAPYREVERAYSSMIGAAEQNTGAGDLALATGFMKMLDPGSVVRESELAISLESAGVIDRLFSRLQGEINAGLGQEGSGVRMSPEAREAVLKVAQDLYEFQRAEADKEIAYYGDLASQQRIPPEFIYRDINDPVARPTFGGTPDAAPADEGITTTALPSPEAVDDMSDAEVEELLRQLEEEGVTTPSRRDGRK